MSDQLRWPIAADAWIVLDGAERVCLEVRGQRTELRPDDNDLSEVLRQARAAQMGEVPDWHDPAVRAEMMRRAAQARYDTVRQSIAAACARHLPDDTAHPSRADAIAADVMTGIAAVIDNAVTITADAVLRQLADDSHWRAVLGAVIQAEDAARLTELRNWIRQIAALPADDESPAGDILRRIAGEARAYLGWQAAQSGSPDMNGAPDHA